MTSNMLPFTNHQSALGGDNELAWHNANHEYGILALVSLLYQSPDASAPGGSYSNVDLA